MTRFIPYEKLSKKEKRAYDAKQRGSWGDLSPVSRKVESKKVYNRAKAKHSAGRSAECTCFIRFSSLHFLLPAL